jgi:hypothetical protein
MEMCGKPIGMFHCPICGEMVLACFPHPDYSILDDEDSMDERRRMTEEEVDGEAKEETSGEA